MSAMAILTFCGLAITQVGDFSVESVEIRFGNIQVTFTANAHDLKLESFFVCPFDHMR